MVIKVKRKTYKPLSFSTTMRNPARIAAFLECVEAFEGHVLTNDVICEIIVSILMKKLYKPMSVGRKAAWKNIYESENTFTKLQAKEIMIASPQFHKEAGFDKGWPSRFDTFYKLPMEFGFLYYSMGEQIEISKTGHILLEAMRKNDNEKIQKIFLNALTKYQTNNPFRRTLNDNAPLPLLLQVIKLLKEDQEENDSGIFIKELPLIICSPDANANNIYQLIKSIRKIYKFSYGDELIYRICLDMLGAGQSQTNRFKIGQITGEAVDEFIRKMRFTGIVSLRGNGRFLDFNTFEQNTIDYILDRYVSHEHFESKKKYYEYISDIDWRLFIFSEEPTQVADTVKERTLEYWATNYSFEYISNELENLSKKNSKSDNEVLKILDEPVRLEFLTSILIKQRFPKLIVKPNYSVDDEGLPKFTASGGMADIECFDDDNNPLIEVTLMCSRQQATGEIPSITRHLEEAIDMYKDRFVFTLFIAPVIHRDTMYMTDYSFMWHGVDIVPLTITQFIYDIVRIKKLEDFVYLSIPSKEELEERMQKVAERIDVLNRKRY